MSTIVIKKSEILQILKTLKFFENLKIKFFEMYRLLVHRMGYMSLISNLGLFYNCERLNF